MYPEERRNAYADMMKKINKLLTVHQSALAIFGPLTHITLLF